MAVQKKYICGFCARAFTRSEHKQRHERSHTNEKPFHCIYCTSAFVRRDLLQRHCRTVHNIKLTKSIKDEGETPTNIITSIYAENCANSTNPAVAPTPAVSLPITSNSSDSSANSNGEEMESIEPDKTDESDLIHLLSISKNLYSLLDDEDLHACQTNESFLIGYNILSNQPHSIFKLINNSLINYLNSSNYMSDHLIDFKVGLIYSILSIGNLNNPQVSQYFSNKSWNVLIDKLLPNFNSLNYQIEILKNLFVLAFIYVKFNNNNLILDYLEETSLIILKNYSNSNLNSDFNNELFWNIYLLLSNYKINDAPPKCYSLFLNKFVPNKSITLMNLMNNYSKSINLIDDDFLNDIIISTLSNELNSLIYGKSLKIYKSQNYLHNSIILINKSINKKNTNMDNFDIFNIFKKNLIINSSVKFKDLLNSYIYKLSHKLHWNLLIISLKEFNMLFNFNSFINLNLDLDFKKFSENLLGYLKINIPKVNSISDHADILSKNFDFLNLFFQQINNNLGIVSFPIIFQAKFLKFNDFLPNFSLNNFSNADLNHLNNLLIEWVVTLFKILVYYVQFNKLKGMRDFEKFNNDSIKNNYIFQCLLFLLNDENPNFGQYNVSLIWKLFNRIELIYNNWIEFFNNKTYLLCFNKNLFTFMNSTLTLLLNSNEFIPLNELVVYNGSVGLKDNDNVQQNIVTNYKRSKSIGTIEHNLTSYASSSSLLAADNNSDNYILMNNEIKHNMGENMNHQLHPHSQPMQSQMMHTIPPPPHHHQLNHFPLSQNRLQNSGLMLPPIQSVSGSKDQLKPILPFK